MKILYVTDYKLKKYTCISELSIKHTQPAERYSSIIPV